MSRRRNAPGRGLLAAALFAALVFGARPASAQLGFGGDDQFDFGYGEPKPQVSRPAILPYGKALELAFSSATWSQLQLSSAPAREMTLLLERGYYHLEVVELILLAQATRTPLPELVKERDKGKSFRELAEERHQDAVALYEQGLDVRRRADTLAAGLSSQPPPVAVSTSAIQEKK